MAKINRAAREGRCVVIDCETTGLSPAQGDRMVSFAAIELADGEATGKALSLVFNPGRKCSAGARRVHGLSDAFLAKQDEFARHAADIADFIGGTPVVAHNASFDMGFLRSEMNLANTRYKNENSVCTMWMFRNRFPGLTSSLDACCQHYGLDNACRQEHHGAFIDAALAAALFYGLTDVRMPPFAIAIPAEIAPTNAR